jgi:hypothetical protein
LSICSAISAAAIASSDDADALQEVHEQIESRFYQSEVAGDAQTVGDVLDAFMEHVRGRIDPCDQVVEPAGPRKDVVDERRCHAAIEMLVLEAGAPAHGVFAAGC